MGEHTAIRAVLLPTQLNWRSQIRLLDATTNLQENQWTKGHIQVSTGVQPARFRPEETLPVSNPIPSANPWQGNKRLNNLKTYTNQSQCMDLIWILI